MPLHLPNEEETFLLFTNNDNDYPVTIKGMCWKIPPYVYMPRINKLKKVGYMTRAKNYFNVLVDTVFFKYIECVCKNERIIFDMENLAPCSFTTSKDLYKYKLPIKTEKEEGFFIKYSETYPATKGIRNNAPSRTTIERSVTMNGNHFVLTLKLRKDARDIITRNSLELKSTNLISTHDGALVNSKCVVYSKFLEEN